jgi:hypothetical protein
MQSVGIVLMSILAAVVFGIIHDQITARVCIEYFTVAHPKVVESEDPTVLGLVWGIVATWWTGLLLGIPLAIAARVGSRPKYSVRTLRQPVLVVLGLMAMFALITGIISYVIGSMGTIILPLPGPMKDRIPAQKWPAFQACAFAHTMSYFVAFIGGGMTIAWVWVSRKRLRTRVKPHS